MLANLARLLLDAVAPRRCAGCDAVALAPLCPGCERRLTALPLPRPRRLRHGSAFAGFVFVEPVRSALHRGKYGGDKGALRALATLTSSRLGDLLTALPDAVIAVPLGSRRRRQRGYNQAEIIAGVIASHRGLRTRTGLERVRETPPQSDRDEGARRRNVAGAFAWRGVSLASARLWLVDDVLTTGATVAAAAAALEDAGAARIDVIVVAVVP